ncbi:MAG: lamin tail domain-containing protein [Verrucomicrobiae bacterium]|nr:lamin tail domain-containing protein [Verrucomicrobiae bacterium]
MMLSLVAFSSEGQVIISEFMASNGKTLADEDGDYSDWIELQNTSSSAVNLNGWFLTDNASRPTKWRLPAVTLSGNGFLMVFASGKDRAIPGAPLHANFSLSADGEYLALFHPDGVTAATEFAPQFPPQFRDVSYGRGQLVTTNLLLPTGTAGRYLVPTSGALGDTWTQHTFNDSTWSSGTNGLGYETEVAGFAVRCVKANVIVDSLATADDVLANSAQQVSVTSENVSIINYFNTGGEGHYADNLTFPGLVMDADVDDFVVEVTATIHIPTPGQWTFGVNSDDGFRLNVGSAFELAYPNQRAPDDTMATFNFAAAGDYALRLVFYERAGGAGLELFAAPGSFTTWNSSNFRLVGDTAHGGLTVRATPVTSGGGGGSLRAAIVTDIETQMKGVSGSVYFRLPFNVSNPTGLESLVLRMRDNDGFVAYLNGEEVARQNAPATPQWNSTATDSRSVQASLTAEEFNLSDQIGRLVPGVNTLAVHGLNEAAGDVNFLLHPELVEYQVQSLTDLYFTTPTPGALNGDGVSGFVTPPQFSVERGFYDAPFNLELTTPTPGAIIRYTTNGTAPTLTNGLVYSAPLNINQTTVIRAAAFLDAAAPSAAVTHTYFFVQDIVQQSPTGAPPPGWPSSWGANVVDYGMDPNVTTAPAYAATLTNDLKAIPSFSIVMNLTDLFNPTTGIYANPQQDGRAWERPCSVELIYPDGTTGFQIPAGIRIRGGYSRSTANPKHAFRLFFRSEYGAAKLKYPLFGDRGAASFDKVDLRTFQNYSWSFEHDSRGIFVRDQFNRDLQLALGHSAERGDYYHLYINGQYWGVYNTCERPEASYAETYWGGKEADYDVIKVEAGPYTLNATDGNMDAWTQLYLLAKAGFASDAAYQLVQGNNPDGTRNLALANLLDVPNLIDYMLIIYYGGNLDAPISNFLGNERPNNFYAVRDRLGTDGFRFFIHDAEHTLLDVNQNRLGPYVAGDTSVWYSSPQWLFQKLMANAEFRLRVADHVQRHFFNNGPLTPARVRELFLQRTDQIDRAVVGESARWGDAKGEPPLTRANWLNAVNDRLNNYLPQRSSVVLNQLRAAGLYPNVAAPIFSQFGGNITNGFKLNLSASSGTIYYTLDGSDPRLVGGAISPTAQVYTGSVTLAESGEVKARVLSGTTWSALNASVFTVIQTFTDLIITEIMYHPPDTEDFTEEQLEFLELKNVGSEELDLSGVHFTEGIQYTFPLGTRLSPDGFVVLVRDPVAFTNQYPGVRVDGVFTGRLANSGERLTLAHAVGTPIFSVAYSDAPPWPTTADGSGFSLVPLHPNVNPDPDDPANWRSSSAVGGSPGQDDLPANISPILINEILTHTDLPQLDAIELYNPNAVPVDVGHWYLSDQRLTPKQFQIPAATVIPPGGYVVFDETDFNPQPGVPPSFRLSSHGEEIYLFSADATGNLTGYSHGFAFGAAANGVSFGRYVLSTGAADYPAQKALSLGATNAGPLVGPVVISEIHCAPLPGQAQFIELHNLTAAPVTLFNSAHPDLTWRINGIGFQFPTNVTLAAQGYLLVVSGDPTAFRANYDVPPQVPIFGPFTGTLQSNGERLQLLRPDNPDLGEDGQLVVPEIVVDEVRYGVVAPWPALPAGSGHSLERLDVAAYGNDPINWRTSPGPASPGVSNTGNRAPLVDAGNPQQLTYSSVPVAVSLSGSVSDDGVPSPAQLTSGWSQISGPGSVWFADATASDTSAYFSGGGVYQLRLSASDGELSSSSDVVITLTRNVMPLTFVSAGAVWKYYDLGGDLPTDWNTLGFNDASWSSGPARLGYGSDGEATIVSYGNDPDNRHVTTWFRHQFTVSHADSVTALKVGLARDDGGVVYLNGVEVFRSNMPEGDLTATTYASSAVGGVDEATFFEHAVDPSLLVEGDNVLAARIHQVSSSSTDLGFNLYLTGNGYPPNVAPTVNAGADQSINLNEAVALGGQVSDDGLPVPPGLLTWNWSKISGPGTTTFADAQALQTTATFSLSGNYVLRLTASDGGLSATDDVTIEVQGPAFETWRAQHFTPVELANPTVSGADADPDLDGHSNYQEYLADTDPRDPASVLKIVAVTTTASNPPTVQIEFNAVSSRAYALQSCADAPNGVWENLMLIPAPAQSGVVIVSAPLSTNQFSRYFRIVTPPEP